MSKRESRKRPHEDASGDPIIEKYYSVEKMIEGKVEKIPAQVIASEWQYPLNYDDANEGREEEAESSEKKIQMYYVHYENLDRRNDEWVTREKIREEVEPPAADTIVVPEEVKKVDGAPGSQGAMTRSQRRFLEDAGHINTGFKDLDATQQRLEKEHVERTKVKNVPRIIIGPYTINAWYFSPFPPECRNREVYMCEYCLLYTPKKAQFQKHFWSCKQRQPPGAEIYRKDNLSIYEVDGNEQKIYCQCLCLFSKLFMDHKTLYFDVDDFMFYVLCEVDSKGAHIVGYFSREVESANNLACIMVFPPFQKKGYGKLLIQMSYELSDREGYVGTPEKPLSDLGKVSYRSYWWWQLMKQFEEHQGHTVTVSFLSAETGIAYTDIVDLLNHMKIVRQYREPEFIPNEWYCKIHKKIVDHIRANNYGRPPALLLDKTCVRWRPAQTRAESEAHQKRNEQRRASNSAATTPLPTPPILDHGMFATNPARNILVGCSSPASSYASSFPDTFGAASPLVAAPHAHFAASPSPSRSDTPLSSSRRGVGRPRESSSRP